MRSGALYVRSRRGSEHYRERRAFGSSPVGGLVDALTRLWWWLLRVLLVLVPSFVIVNAFMLLAGELADLPSGSEVIALWGLALSLAWVGTRRLRAVTRRPVLQPPR